MRIPSFEFRSQRTIGFAKCDNVPKLMIVAGPNGCGKSTLLDAIRKLDDGRHIMYVGPHRSIRRQNVQQRYLLTRPIVLEELLMRSDTPGFDGISLLGGHRDPWGYDDTGNYLKHGLCQIEVERQQAISTRYDRDGEIQKNTLADPWKPLRELTHNLLPHLAFSRIDASNRDQVKCLWQVHGTETIIDFDDLSSGEKSIIQMFYPLVEHEIKDLLSDIQSGSKPQDRPPICVLIDEPELHLHPNLQFKVMDYLRVLSSGQNVQVILATHSPTIVEYASFEELYLLRPVELVGADENQLVRIADNDERLQLLRDLFGTTANLTAMQPIVIVEGSKETNSSRIVPDRKLYRALHPGFDKVTLIPGGGKGECKALISALNDALKHLSTRLRAVGLLDRDVATTADADGIHLLPVSMIENFLLDPDSIWEAIQSIVEKTTLLTVDDVSSGLDKVLDLIEAEEIARRTLVTLGVARFRPSTPVNAISAQVDAFIKEINTKYSPEKIQEAESASQRIVSDLRNSHRRREEFHGKTALQSFYKTHLHSTGLDKVVFTFETARHARRRKAVVTYFDGFFDVILSI